MIFITGGAHQGKLTFARNTWGLQEEDIYTCTGAGPDLTRRCVRRLEVFTLHCVREGLDAAAVLEARRSEWRDSLLLCRDIGGGVVPLGEECRAWREENGRLCRYLAERAGQVYRVFCGLPQRLK